MTARFFALQPELLLQRCEAVAAVPLAAKGRPGNLA